MPHGHDLKTGEACRGREIMVENPDGTVSYALAYPELLLGANGEVEGAVNLLFDITERKRPNSSCTRPTWCLRTARRSFSAGKRRLAGRWKW
ncbi:MAG: hypothetical protein R2864_00890 [Syntrophotaleaceae bacterium]